MKAVATQNLVKSFENGGTKTEVLKSITMDCFPGEILMIVGPSGCGKTTLLSCIAGILDIDLGEVTLFGTSIQQLSQNQLLEFRKKNIGFIFQQFNLIPTLTIAENVSIPLLINGVEEKKALRTAFEWLAKVGLDGKQTFRPSQLSGGQQQRVAIARALVHDPKLLICDEPTSALDGKTGHSVVQLLKEVAQKQDRAVIIVTHDSRIFEFASRIIEMEDGQIKAIYQDAKAFNHSSL